MGELRDVIYSVVFKYMDSAPDCKYVFGEHNAREQCFIMHQMKRGTVRANITGSWINLGPPGMEHAAQLAHHHLNKKAHVSVVYYVKTGDATSPAPSQEQGPAERASVNNSEPEGNPSSAGTWFFSEAHGEPLLFRPAVSGVLVFPGWLSHRMDSHWGPEARITVAANLFVEHVPPANKGLNDLPLEFAAATKNVFSDSATVLPPQYPGRGSRGSLPGGNSQPMHQEL